MNEGADGQNGVRGLERDSISRKKNDKTLNGVSLVRFCFHIFEEIAVR